MTVSVSFYSYFKDLAGCARLTEELPPGSTLEALLEKLAARLPSWGGMRQSCLTAVGVEYQPRNYVLQPGDEVALFPPVQGG
jgi:molybdopterin converting factor small subunit